MKGALLGLLQLFTGWSKPKKDEKSN